ncbi:cyclic nucleotide-binding domain-containing protein, partial [Chloroflexota bacterium]
RPNQYLAHKPQLQEQATKLISANTGGCMNLPKVLQGVDLFGGLSDQELEKVAKICKHRQFEKNEIIAQQGEIGNELFIIIDGFVEVVLGERAGNAARVVVSMGGGQIIGEMALLDQGPRSASIRATSDPTTVQVIQRDNFEELCQRDTNIGYIVMRNLAADLSFKLRLRNLSEIG